MLNGAYFVPSGAGAADNYVLASSLGAKPAILVETITGEAGVLQGRQVFKGLNPIPPSIFVPTVDETLLGFNCSYICFRCRTESNRNDNTHMSVSAASISIFSTSHSHPIIHIFICAACLAVMDVLR